MNCPHCGASITRLITAALKARAQASGAKGGSATGPSKRRDVDYAALGRLAAAARKANRIK